MLGALPARINSMPPKNLSGSLHSNTEPLADFTTPIMPLRTTTASAAWTALGNLRNCPSSKASHKASEKMGEDVTNNKKIAATNGILFL